MRSAAGRPVLLFAVIAAAGGLGFALGAGGRACLSFLAGLVVASLAATLGIMLVEIAGRIAPAMAMVAALSNYALTVLFFLLLLRAVDPDVADVPAFATGLACSVVPYLAWQFARARPRP
jgi:hypothetical protein